jgi:hypothetical protein
MSCEHSTQPNSAHSSFLCCERAPPCKHVTWGRVRACVRCMARPGPATEAAEGKLPMESARALGAVS